MIKLKHMQKYICFYITAALLFTGCGSIGNETLTETQNMETENIETEPAELAEPKDSVVQVIDYPFPYDKEDWQLMLRKEHSAGEKNTYRIRLYDGEDNLLQDFPCDIEAEKLVFRFDQLYDYRTALAVFPEEAQTSGEGGLLFVWDSEKEGFQEEPIAIPWYEKVNSNYTFLVTDQQGNTETTTICCINRGTGQIVELRSRTWSKDSEMSETGKLIIRDCLEDKVLYDGEVDLGELLNNSYYEELFSGELHWPWDISAEAEIPVARIISNGENDWHFETQTYESREALLVDCGFQGAEPFYQYYDRLQNLEMELYLDESTGSGCGFQYSYGFNYELEKIVQCKGFVFDRIKTGEWEDDTFSLLVYDGIDARERRDVTQVNYSYTADGKMLSYEVRGITELTRVKWEIGEDCPDDPLLSMTWVYRSDGTLYRKDYSHDSLTFSTSCQSQRICYDELGRPAYRYEYITHGSFDYYYIYDGEKTQPKYRLSLDQDGGYAMPSMIVYR